MKKEKNLQKGITLISLVITIIVLLILAGVAITMAVDADGLFPRAEYAKDSWNNRVAEEESTINNALLILNKIDLQGGTGTGGGGDDDEPVLPEGWNKEAVASVVEEGERKAPIPKGYAASQIPGEDKISDGLVIYEGDAPVTGAKDGEAHQAAMRDRNQYVWIPVDNINSMIMCQTHGASVKLDTDTLQCPDPECGAATKLAGKLYATKTDNNFDKTLSNQTYTQVSGFHEPDILTYNDCDSTNGITSMQDEFNEMAKSVAKYKGFYISRYEIQANAASKKGATVLNDGSSNAGNWYGLFNIIKDSTKPNGSTVAQMIWGCQYDQVMILVDGKPDGTGTTFDIKTKDYRRHGSSFEVSGNTPADLVYNIYDLECNYDEWTAEAYGSEYRVSRGGDYWYTEPASRRGEASPMKSSDYGYGTSRATLYVK